MFLMYLKSAFRGLIRNKQLTFINIIGLAVGFSTCLVIGGYVIHEYTFESSHENRASIYRVSTEMKFGKALISNATAAAPLGPAAQASIPEIENFTRLFYQIDPEIVTSESRIKEKQIYFVDPQFLNIFTISLDRGYQQTALRVPFSLLVDDKLADKYFGRNNPVGQVLRLAIEGKEYDFTITGVFKSLPTNTTLKTSLLASFSLPGQIEQLQKNEWNPFDIFSLYFQLRNNADPKEVEKKVQTLGQDSFGAQNKDVRLFFQPLEQIYSEGIGIRNNYLNNASNPERTKIFLVIALLILLLATINYVNLSTARIMGRMKEVAVRKTCGAGRGNLAVQFLVESGIVTILSMLAGLLLFYFFKPQLDNYLGSAIPLDISSNLWFPFLIFGLILIIGMVGGSYPAYLLSRFQPSMLMHQNAGNKPGKLFLRRIFVTLQYTITIGMIGYVLVVAKQIRYMETENLGYNKNNMLVLKSDERGDLSVLAQEIQNIPGVKSTTSMMFFPAGEDRGFSRIQIEGEIKQRMVQAVGTDPGFLQTFGVRLADGRNFIAGSDGDSKAVLINETAVKKFSITDPIGKRLIVDETPMEIIGVVKDFHTNSLHLKIEPTIIQNMELNPEYFSCLVVRIEKSSPAIIDRMHRVWNQVYPEKPFHYDFSEDIINRAYGKEERLAQLLFYLCILIILVACLGIFGLSAFSAEKRTKEIGIRKVLGASAERIVFLLSRDVAVWVIAANIFAWPIGWWAADKWLNDFPYHATITIIEFLLAGFMALVVALAAASVHTVRAALAKPVDSLRYE